MHAVVKRPDNVSSTVLRKIATNARDDSAWVEDHTKVRACFRKLSRNPSQSTGLTQLTPPALFRWQVANGERVVVMEPDRGGFTRVQASNGTQGFIKSSYLR